MKKWIIKIIIVLVALTILGSCTGGKSKKQEAKPEAEAEATEVIEEKEKDLIEEAKAETVPVEAYYGTWALDTLIDGDEQYSVEELEDKGDTATASMLLILNENGQVRLSMTTNDVDGQWAVTDAGIIVGSMPAALKDGKLELVSEGSTALLIKISDSQEFISQATENTQVPEGSTETVSEDGLRPEFKEAMDAYEKFMDEYVAFMEEYKKDSSSTKMLVKYAEYMSKYAKCIEIFEAWESEDMTKAETLYYIDVNTRVSNKLLKAAQ